MQGELCDTAAVKWLQGIGSAPAQALCGEKETH